MSELPAPSPAGSQALPGPALDFAAGLERVMGDQPMYLRVLTRFRSDYAGNAARLRAALYAGDLPLAQRIAHTIKGAAAMIEARYLRALAADIEQGLRTGLAAPQLPLDRLEAELALVMTQVDGLLAAPPAMVQTAGAEPIGDTELARLCAMLDLGDSAAQDLIQEKNAGLRTLLGAARMAELESAAAAFDFERALAVLAHTQRQPAPQA
ncbi:Hpt domain-containing protein [Massilia yuzhufengensis]|uniref:Two-component system, unclassified family, sensor histidine kinase and response regulator n=1 Tax=Massilia yuzhufengensis TaxID=1164594 RepID=A0A1I1LK94_9BURK|nr:Hpt domain-containing protein [Massilia yuzhufengensis]SFC73395.1 two-component system, unclassified family, sensor histidine kinase and response regulator [Massilia yuzhufengensis]